MKPGPELDALVAEKVMGIKCGATLSDGMLRPITMDWGEVPSYSTSIAAAWEVVEKITERWTVEVTAVADDCPCYDSGVKAQCWIHDCGKGSYGYRSWRVGALTPSAWPLSRP